MNSSTRKIGFCLIGTATALLTANWQLQAQDEDKFLLPKVAHDVNGFLTYQPIKLKNYVMSLSEFKNSLEGNTSFMNFTVNKDDENHLANFRLRLDTAASESFSQAPEGAQALIPNSNFTIYNDLDGDTMLDTMVKMGPEKHESYILYKNSWVQVNNNMMGFAIGRPVGTIPQKERYVFKKHEWELTK